MLQLISEPTDLVFQMRSIFLSALEGSFRSGYKAAIKRVLISLGIRSEVTEKLFAFVFGSGPELAELIVDLFTEI